MVENSFILCLDMWLYFWQRKKRVIALTDIRNLIFSLSLL